MKPIADANLRELLLMLVGRRQRMRVVNDSMRPTLTPGTVVLVDANAYRQRKPEPGEVVVAQHPYEAAIKIIKRVEFEDDNGAYFLCGDNPSAGRSFANISQEQIVGRVTSVLSS